MMRMLSNNTYFDEVEPFGSASGKYKLGTLHISNITYIFVVGYVGSKDPFPQTFMHVI